MNEKIEILACLFYLREHTLMSDKFMKLYIYIVNNYKAYIKDW